MRTASAIDGSVYAEHVCCEKQAFYEFPMPGNVRVHVDGGDDGEISR